MTNDNNDGADLLYGAPAVAAFLGIRLKQAQHLIEARRIPSFRIGKTVAARRSKVIAALEGLEEATGR
jgi:hypothetical protein